MIRTISITVDHKAFVVAASILAVLASAMSAANRGHAAEPLADPLRFEQPKLDPGKIEKAGLRKIEGKHLVLYTDVASSPEVDALPKVFDLAVPQWCQYMGFDPKVAERWRMTGCLIHDKTTREKFVAAGLVPAGLPDFLDGLQRGPQFWWYEQTSDYFRRHLLLHEGTHAFFEAFCGALGPAWYAEGMADMLATHTWDGRKLTLNVMPSSRKEFPYWGRIKLIKDDVDAGVPRSLATVIRVDFIPFGAVDHYAWSWGACAFFDHDPARRKAFRELTRRVRESPERFAQSVMALSPNANRLSEEWQLFANDLDYGYGIERGAIVHREEAKPPKRGDECEVVADRGWQSTGWQVRLGVRYQLTAEGRFQVANQPKPWISEPAGVTLRYHRGVPLGQLQAAVSTALRDPPDERTPMLKPSSIGAGKEWTSPADGVLYLRLNDSPAERADNSGTCRVRIDPVR